MSSTDHWFFRPHISSVNIRIDLDRRINSSLRILAQRAHPKETGGLVLGWWDGEIPRVSGIVEVPDPTAGYSQWRRDESAASTVLAIAMKTAKNSDVGYIGDWHSHPANVGPSRADISELKRASRQYSHALIMIVVRYGGAIDTRLALRGSLTTPQFLERIVRENPGASHSRDKRRSK